MIGQVFVTGKSDQSYAVAIVVPDLIKLRLAFKDREGINTESLKTMIESEEVCKTVFDDIRDKLKTSKLNSFEKPMRIYLAHDEMTVENDCLTPTLKVRRNFAVRMFAKNIDEL